jgi:hypothetical protein
MNFRICCAIRMLGVSESILGTHLLVSGRISGRHEFGGVTGALVALRGSGRAEFRPTEMPMDVLSSRLPSTDAFALLQMGTYERESNIPLRGMRAGDNRSSAYSVARRKKLLPLCVRCGLLARRENGVLLVQKLYLRLAGRCAPDSTPRRPGKGYRASTDCQCPSIALETAECTREQKGGLQNTLVARSRVTPAGAAQPGSPRPWLCPKPAPHAIENLEPGG